MSAIQSIDQIGCKRTAHHGAAKAKIKLGKRAVHSLDQYAHRHGYGAMKSASPPIIMTIQTAHAKRAGRGAKIVVHGEEILWAFIYAVDTLRSTERLKIQPVRPVKITSIKLVLGYTHAAEQNRNHIARAKFFTITKASKL